MLIPPRNTPHLRTILTLLSIATIPLLSVACQPKKPAQIRQEVTQNTEPPSTTVAEATPSPTPAPASRPKRIILFIGDGMGNGAVTAATYAKGELLEMEKMPHFTWMGNHEYEYVTTDSAASASAFATGKKTHFEAVSVKPGTTDDNDDHADTHFRSALRAAKDAGMKTGLVATSRINHATPAAFASNRYHRKTYEEIAMDEANAGVDVLLGAGSKFFTSRKDGKNLFDELKEKGYSIANTAEEVRSASKSASKMVGLMHEKDMPYVREGTRAMSLAEMTKHAIEVLDRDNDKGWFLMVEGSQIDWCEHHLAGLCTISETLDFDEAVGVGRNYAKNRNDTLLVVTADHETGGVSVLQPNMYAKYASMIGGFAAAVAGTAPGAGENYKGAVEPIPAIAAIGDKSAKFTVEQVPATNAFGLIDYPDARFTVSFGFLSVASRHLYQGTEDFSAAHTTTFVPLFTEGAGAKAIAEITDNADLGQKLIDFMDNKQVTYREEPPTSTPKNVILLIGDGMGINSVAAAYYNHGDSTMLSSPVKGIVSTNGTDFVVNDSAATATALASGHRTRRGALGVIFQPGSGAISSVESILERAESVGRKTGLVTTTPLYHATPAGFYAHVDSRYKYPQIVEQFINLPQRIKGSDGVDIAIAGGSALFTSDKQKALEEQGYTYLTKWTNTPLPEKAVVLLAKEGLPIAQERKKDATMPSLAEMTTAAIDVLQRKNEKGFFLMVEGGEIDWLLHGRDNTTRLPDEVADFDEAVRAAVDFAKKDGNTLVVVTADHNHTMSLIDNHYAFRKKETCLAAKQCGGDVDFPDIPVAKKGIKHMEGFSNSTLQGENYTPLTFHIQYDWLVTTAGRVNPTSAPHSANFVPLFAWGPSSTSFESFKQQPDVGKLFFTLTKW